MVMAVYTDASLAATGIELVLQTRAFDAKQQYDQQYGNETRDYGKTRTEDKQVDDRKRLHRRCPSKFEILEVSENLTIVPLITGRQTSSLAETNLTKYCRFLHGDNIDTY